MEFRFASLLRPETTGYIVSSDWRFLRDSGRRVRHFANWAATYETYGDGNVQHAPETPVLAEQFGDFCGSLVSALTDSRNDDALAVVAGHWPNADQVSPARVRFLRGLRYDENKRRYYDLGGCKASTAESKRYDTRWKEVPSWADGDVGSVFALMDSADGTLLQAYVAYTAIRDRIWADEETYMGSPVGWLKLEGADNRFADDAYEGLASMVAAFKARKHAARCLECWTKNTANARANDAEKALAASA